MHGPGYLLSVGDARGVLAPFSPPRIALLTGRLVCVQPLIPATLGLSASLHLIHAIA